MKLLFNPGEEARRWAHVALLMAAPIGLYFMYHHAVFFEVWSDENIHLYVARRVADGLSLYGDIHSARPPLAIFPLAFLLDLGMPPLAAARGTVILAVLSTAAAVGWAGSKLWGMTAGTWAAILFILSPAVAGRFTYTGINVVTAWSTICAVTAFHRMPIVSGITGGLALCAGQHSAVIVGLSSALSAASGSRRFLKFAAGCSSATALVLASSLASGGNEIFSDLIGHHLYHFGHGESVKETAYWWWMSVWSSENIHVLLLASWAVVARILIRPKALFKFSGWMDPVVLLTFFALAHVAIVSIISGSQILYVQPAFPLLAIVAGKGMLQIVACSNGDFQSGKSRREKAVMMMVALIFTTAAGWTASKALLERRDDRDYSLIPHLRLVRMARIQRPKVAREIETMVQAGLPGGGKIFGYPTITTLVASGSRTKIAGEMADIDPAWIKTGIMQAETIIKSIELDGVEYFITPAWFFVKDPIFSQYLKKCYNRPVIFHRKAGSGIPRILVYKRLDKPRPCVGNEKDE